MNGRPNDNADAMIGDAFLIVDTLRSSWHAGRRLTLAKRQGDA